MIFTFVFTQVMSDGFQRSSSDNMFHHFFSSVLNFIMIIIVLLLYFPIECSVLIFLKSSLISSKMSLITCAYFSNFLFTEKAQIFFQLFKVFFPGIFVLLTMITNRLVVEWLETNTKQNSL